MRNTLLSISGFGFSYSGIFLASILVHMFFSPWNAFFFLLLYDSSFFKVQLQHPPPGVTPLRRICPGKAPLCSGAPLLRATAWSQSGINWLPLHYNFVSAQSGRLRRQFFREWLKMLSLGNLTLGKTQLTASSVPLPPAPGGIM